MKSNSCPQFSAPLVSMLELPSWLGPDWQFLALLAGVTVFFAAISFLLVWLWNHHHPIIVLGVSPLLPGTEEQRKLPLAA